MKLDMKRSQKGLSYTITIDSVHIRSEQKKKMGWPLIKNPQFLFNPDETW